jgi:prolyl oligopeptidase PreP (S9A serine peptidase family)
MLKRNESLSKASIIFNCAQGAMSAYVSSQIYDGVRYTMVVDQLSFYESETHIVDFENNKLIKIPIPRSANLEAIYKGQILFSTREILDQFRAGSILSFPYSEIAAYKVNITSVFTPSSQRFFESMSLSKNSIYIQVIDDV